MKKRMVKWVSICLTGVMMLGLLAGCGSGGYLCCSTSGRNQYDNGYEL